MEVPIVPNAITTLDFVDTVYLMSILTDQQRRIDGYIDYFGSGGPPPVTPATAPMDPTVDDDQGI
jgi:hypothetical protein